MQVEERRVARDDIEEEKKRIERAGDEVLVNIRADGDQWVLRVRKVEPRMETR